MKKNTRSEIALRIVRKALGYMALGFSACVALAMAVSAVMAQTDIPSTVATLTGYWTTIVTLAITVLAFVIGRKLVRKI
jgi:hypothetical protein